MGVKPGQVADLLALMGDSIDNIPGAPGIGEKGARDLIARFGSVENALDHASEVERKMYRESLLNNRDRILLSKKLATIDTTVPIECEVTAFAAAEPDITALRGIYKELEFTSLLRELGPAEDAHTRDYQTLTTREEVAAYIDAIPAEKPVAVAVQTAGRAGTAADHDRHRVEARRSARVLDRTDRRRAAAA